MNETFFPGIPDSQFIRGSVPMTKEEVRVLALAKLRLEKKSRVLDIGAGTGSVSIEAARIALWGRVIAVEKNPEAVHLIEHNRSAFGLENLDIVQGEAPGALTGIGSVDRVFIGGSGGALAQIIEWSQKNLVDRGHLVITAITLDTVQQGLTLLEAGHFQDIQAIQVGINRLVTIKQTRLLQAQNPVFIISAEKR